MAPGDDTGLGNKPIIVIVGLIASLIAIFTFITGKESVPEILNTPTPPGVVVITVQSPPTQVLVTSEPNPTATPKRVSLGTIRVPGSAEEGIKFVADQDGRYVFMYTSGAYSPWPGAEPTQPRWRTRINVYKNRPILWGQRPYNPEDDRSIVYKEPRNPDAYIGNYDVATQDEAIRVAQSSGTLQFDLHAGDYLIFVASDDQGWYNNPGPNIGEVVFEVTVVTNR